MKERLYGLSFFEKNSQYFARILSDFAVLSI